jgi:pilus assembly protein FimV
MKLNRKPVTWGIFAALLLSASYSSALTLGRIRGAALLGKPLDVVVPVQYASEEEVSSACFEAVVYFGDTPLESSTIAVSLQPGPQPNNQLVRVTSSAGVDEPLVRITLRTVCNPRASRQYTLLVEVVSELAGAGVVARAAGTNVATGVVTPVGTAPSAAVTAGDPDRPAASPATPLQPQRARTALKPAAAGVGGASNLKAGSALSVAALEDLQRRVDDIAKWQASGGSADDLLKSEARVKALESDIRGLQVVTAKNQQNIQTVATAIESNGAQGYGRPLAYGLGALLLACIAALAYVVQQMRFGGFTAAPWWSSEPERAQATELASAPARATAPASLNPADSRAGALAASLAQKHGDQSPGSGPAALDARDGDTSASTVSMDFTAAATGLPVAQQPGIAGRPVRPDFASSAPGSLKSINTKEMLDVRQQAEFFMALGQHDEAVRLLESSIRGSADCNPLMFLDLLKILHTLGRRADFEQYREEFNAQFTGRIPPFAGFLTEGNGLDAYEDICNQIVVLWPTDYTIDYIEQCLVRLPEDDPEQGMDLEAFKDLLLLYGVLKRLDQAYDSNLAPFSAARGEHSQSAPVSVKTAPAPVAPVMDYDLAATPADIDLDLNLDDLDELAPTSEHDNLIDFDMSDYMARKKAEAAK